MIDVARARAARSAYTRWAPTYPPIAHNALMRTEHAAIAALVAPLRPVRALDAGTGSGRHLSTLSSAASSLAVGLDFSWGMLARGPRDRPRVCADACRLPFSAGAFDLINASLMAGDIADLGAWLRECAAALAPGGHLTYSDFHPSWTKYGWRRTFQSVDGNTIELSFVPHTLEEHVEALRSAGFDVLRCQECPLAPLDDAAGPDVERFRRQWGNPPVLAVFHAQRLV